MKDKGAGRSWVYCFSTDHVSNNDSWTFLFLSPGKCQNHSDDYVASSWKRMSAYLLNFFSGVQLLIFSPGSHVLYTYCLLRHSLTEIQWYPLRENTILTSHIKTLIIILTKWCAIGRGIPQTRQSKRWSRLGFRCMSLGPRSARNVISHRSSILDEINCNRNVTILWSNWRESCLTVFISCWDAMNYSPFSFQATSNDRSPNSASQSTDGAGEDIYVNYPSFSRRPKTRI